MAYLHEIYIGSFDSTPATEDGTIQNPYVGTSTQAGETPATNASRFDTLMKDALKVPPAASVVLLPGTFYTNGHPGDNSGTPWMPSNYMRIRGSGMGATTLTLLPVGSATRYAVGIDMKAGSGLVGFELRDLTIDCGLGATPASGTLAGAVRVRGTHILLERIKVRNYGGSGATSSTVVPIITGAGEGSENCQILECSADVPAGGHNCIAALFVFERDLNTMTPTHNGHRFCTIRNCATTGISITYDPPQPIALDRIHAIVPGLGLGTIIEGNQIANCAVGVYYNPPASDKPAKDIVIWNNFFRNVSIGIYFSNDSIAGALAVGRVVLEDNIIELATASGSLSGTIWRTGIRLNTSQSTARFNQITIRKNLIRDVQNPPGVTAGLYGIHAQYAAQIIVENNVISNIAETGSGTGAVYTQNCTARKFFNNEDQGGTLLRGYNGTQMVLELQDAVEDVLLPM